MNWWNHSSSVIHRQIRPMRCARRAPGPARTRRAPARGAGRRECRDPGSAGRAGARGRRAVSSRISHAVAGERNRAYAAGRGSPAGRRRRATAARGSSSSRRDLVRERQREAELDEAVVEERIRDSIENAMLSGPRRSTAGRPSRRSSFHSMLLTGSKAAFPLGGERRAPPARTPSPGGTAGRQPACPRAGRRGAAQAPAPAAALDRPRPASRGRGPPPRVGGAGGRRGTGR